MRSFFDPSVDRIVELIKGQISQVEKKRSRVKVNSSSVVIVGTGKLIMQNIFLIGGFGESQYLQEELDFSLRLRRIQLRRPDTS
jgi:hypothetical protein